MANKAPSASASFVSRMTLRCNVAPSHEVISGP
jgi:hypothetical protein